MTRQRQTVWVSIAGVIAVVLYSGLAALQLLVLTPLAAVPGRALDEIRTEMIAAGEVSGEPVVVVVLLGIGILAGIVVAVVAVRAEAHPALAAVLFLATLAMGGPGFFVASFGQGMALADTFYISAGITLPGVLPFYLVSAIAAVLAVVGAVTTLLNAPPAPRLPASAPTAVTN